MRDQSSGFEYQSPTINSEMGAAEDLWENIAAAENEKDLLPRCDIKQSYLLL